MTSAISSLVRIWNISNSYPRCSLVVYFSIKHSYLCNKIQYLAVHPRTCWNLDGVKLGVDNWGMIQPCLTELFNAISPLPAPLRIIEIPEAFYDYIHPSGVGPALVHSRGSYYFIKFGQDLSGQYRETYRTCMYMPNQSIYQSINQ